MANFTDRTGHCSPSHVCRNELQLFGRHVSKQPRSAVRQLSNTGQWEIIKYLNALTNQRLTYAYFTNSFIPWYLMYTYPMMLNLYLIIFRYWVNLSSPFLLWSWMYCMRNISIRWRNTCSFYYVIPNVYFLIYRYWVNRSSPFRLWSWVYSMRKRSIRLRNTYSSYLLWLESRSSRIRTKQEVVWMRIIRSDGARYCWYVWKINIWYLSSLILDTISIEIHKILKVLKVRFIDRYSHFEIAEIP